jgi:phosphate transport system permease protein
LLGCTWSPTGQEPTFGILPFLLASLYGTVGAILLGVPVGLLTAIYLAKLAPPRLKRTVTGAVGLLAGIPSVVYGLVGMMVLVPGLGRLFHLPDGASLLAAILVLGVMILPTVISVSVTALEAVPRAYEEASLALGATAMETYFRVSVPAAKGGLAAGVVLGVGRAMGETMAVMMVSGNAPNMPGLFQSVRFLTTAVASEMSYASGLQRQALYSIALVLFVFITLVNVALHFFLKRSHAHEKQ